MLVGKSGCGKTTLTQALKGLDLSYKKTQAISFEGMVIDTPGEFTENRRFYSALMATACQCDIIGFVQDVTAGSTAFPPRFAAMFCREVIGIISKTDLEPNGIDRATHFLNLAGVSHIIQTSALQKNGIESLKAILNSVD